MKHLFSVDNEVAEIVGILEEFGKLPSYSVYRVFAKLSSGALLSQELVSKSNSFSMLLLFLALSFLKRMLNAHTFVLLGHMAAKSLTIFEFPLTNLTLNDSTLVDLTAQSNCRFDCSDYKQVAVHLFFIQGFVDLLIWVRNMLCLEP